MNISFFLLPGGTHRLARESWIQKKKKKKKKKKEKKKIQMGP